MQKIQEKETRRSGLRERDIFVQDPMDNPVWGDEEVAVACNDSELSGDSVSIASDTYCYNQSMVFLSEKRALW